MSLDFQPSQRRSVGERRSASASNGAGSRLAGGALSEEAGAALAVLQRYADRGLFRGFGYRALGAGRIEVRFLWHAEWPHVALLDTKHRTLTFEGLLPQIPYRSPMDRALRRFVAQQAAPERPSHRRLDPARVAAKVRNRGGNASLEVIARPGQLAYAVERGLKLVNEIFFGFLAGPYEDYMVTVFNVPEE